jgi:hypothetical protein
MVEQLGGGFISAKDFSINMVMCYGVLQSGVGLVISPSLFVFLSKLLKPDIVFFFKGFVV